MHEICPTRSALNSLFKSRFFWRSLPKRGTQTFYFYFYLNFHQRRRPTEVHKYSISISIQIFTDGGGPRRYTNNFKQDFSESRLKSCDFKKINFFCWILDLGSSAELQKPIFSIKILLKNQFFCWILDLGSSAELRKPIFSIKILLKNQFFFWILDLGSLAELRKPIFSIKILGPPKEYSGETDVNDL